MPFLLYRQIAYVVFGVIFGIPYLLREWKRQGSWKIDLGKLLDIGLPAFILAYYPMVYFIVEIELLLHTFVSHLLLTVSSAQIVFHILFGFVLTQINLQRCL